MLNLIGAVLLLAATPTGDLVDPAPFGEVLTAYVKDSKVDYAGLQKDRAKLDAYVKSIAAVPKADFEAASKEARIAYLLNAYNAYTLVSILDAYPIKKAGGLFNTAPANSIKQIKGVWDTRKHKTAIGDVTLDNIEHDNLRTSKYDEPLSHMALVCASKGCPPLRSEPYVAAKLQAQLEDQARIYLASPYGLVVEGDKVKVSMIFKWFAKDFVKGYKDSLGFVEKYAPADKVEKVKAARKAGTVGYIEYDWTLNEQKKSS